MTDAEVVAAHMHGTKGDKVQGRSGSQGEHLNSASILRVSTVGEPGISKITLYVAHYRGARCIEQIESNCQ